MSNEEINEQKGIKHTEKQYRGINLYQQIISLEMGWIKRQIGWMNENMIQLYTVCKKLTLNTQIQKGWQWKDGKKISLQTGTKRAGWLNQYHTKKKTLSQKLEKD